MSRESRRAYSRASDRFFAWYLSAEKGAFNKALVQQYRTYLQDRQYAPRTINIQLSAIRKLAVEAADNGLMDSQIAAAVARVPGCRTQGRRVGNWLDLKQAESLVHAPDCATLRGKRDAAILASAIGCGLRRKELSILDTDHLQNREGRPVIVDLVSKHGRVRSIPIPIWAMALVSDWMQAAQIHEGPVFRAIDKKGRVRSGAMSAQSIYNVIKGYGCDIGTCIAPHDLRRTFAKLAHTAAAPIEQIQLSLGHASISTTERYLGVQQNLRKGPGDYIPFGRAAGEPTDEIE